MAGIGWRNLKTALAVFICMVISNSLQLEYPFFVVIAAIISMENSIIHSLKAGRSRMMGTVIGAGIGLGCALIAPGNPILCGIGMIGVIFCCNLLKWRKPTQIAGVVFIAIMVGLKGANPLQYSINRIFDTFIGISVAVIVNYLVFPPDYLPKIRQSIGKLLQATEQTLRQIIFSPEKAGLAGYQSDLAETRELVILFYDDQKITRWKRSGNHPDIQKIMSDFHQISNHFQIISQFNQMPALNETNSLQLKQIFDWKNLPYPEPPAGDLAIVFNFHLHEILNLYQEIKAAN